jgi:hypothetical protein
MTSLLSPGAAVPAGCFALELESGATACWLFSHGSCRHTIDQTPRRRQATVGQAPRGSLGLAAPTLT